MNTDEHGYFSERTTPITVIRANGYLVVVKHLCSSVFICGSAFAFDAAAEVTVKDAWVRGTVAAQSVTGAFMTVTSSTDAKLVGVKTPIAMQTEIHESTMKDGVSHMGAVESVALPAGKPVQLKPGGYHMMLMGLSKSVAAGQKVPITLEIVGADGKRSKVEVQAEVRPLGQ
jgi:copper(I)-binding protein